MIQKTAKEWLNLYLEIQGKSEQQLKDIPVWEEYCEALRQKFHQEEIGFTTKGCLSYCVEKAIEQLEKDSMNKDQIYGQPTD